MYTCYETDQHSVWCLQLTLTGVYTLQRMPETGDGMIMRKAMIYMHKTIADYQMVTVLKTIIRTLSCDISLLRIYQKGCCCRFRQACIIPNPQHLFGYIHRPWCSVNVPITASNPMSPSSPRFLKAEMSGILLYDVVLQIGELGEQTIQCSL